MYQSRSGDVEGYAEFVRNAIQRYGAITRTVQITEEPNVTGNAMLDGDYPDVLRAIVAGVQAANGEASRRGFGHLRIGTNTTPLFGPSAGFYMELVKLGGAALVDGLHYIGLDMFPDVFRPLGEPTHTNCHGRFAPLSSPRCARSPQGSVTSRCISPNTGGRRGRTGRQTDRRRSYGM